MSEFIEVPWTTQPPAGTPLDLTNPLTDGLAIAALGVNPANLVNRYGGALTGIQNTGAEDYRPFPNYQRFNATTDYYSTYAQYAAVTEANVRNTMLCYFRSPNASNVSPEPAPINAGIIGMGATSYIDYHTNLDNGIRYGINTGTWYSAFANQVVPADTWTAIASKYDNETLSLWINGVKDDEQTTPSGDATGTGLLIVGGTDNVNVYVNCDVALTLMWIRDLTDSEMAAMGTNMWQIFEPQRIPIFSSAAAGATTSDVNYHGTGRGILRGIGRGVG